MSKNALYLSAGKVEKIILIPDPQKRSVSDKAMQRMNLLKQLINRQLEILTRTRNRCAGALEAKRKDAENERRQCPTAPCGASCDLVSCGRDTSVTQGVTHRRFRLRTRLGFSKHLLCLYVKPATCDTHFVGRATRFIGINRVV